MNRERIAPESCPLPDALSPGTLVRSPPQLTTHQAITPPKPLTIRFMGAERKRPLGWPPSPRPGTTRSAGHRSFSTTEGYIREAANLRDVFGDIYAPVR